MYIPVHIHVYTFVNEGKGLRTGILPVWVFHGTLEALVTILIPATRTCEDYCYIKEIELKHELEAERVILKLFHLSRL